MEKRFEIPAEEIQKLWKNVAKVFEKLAEFVENLWKSLRETFERLAKIVENLRKPTKKSAKFSAKRPKDQWSLYKAPTPARVRRR